MCRREIEHTEIGVSLGLTSGQSVLMVVAEKLVQEIDSFVRDIALVLGGNETSPRFPLVPARPNGLKSGALESNDSHSPSQDFVVLCIKLDIILFKVCV